MVVASGYITGGWNWALEALAIRRVLVRRHLGLQQQILLSIQAIIMSNEVYFNEPGTCGSRWGVS